MLRVCNKAVSVLLIGMLFVIILSGCGLKGDSKSSVKKSKIEIESSNDYIDKRGNLHIVGEIRNVGIKNAGSVRILVELMNEEGKVLAKNFSNTLMEIIPPGETSPFDVVFSGSKIANTAKYNLNVEWEDTTAKPVTGVKVVDYKIEADFYGVMCVTGEVVNSTPKTMQNVKIVTTFYNNREQVILVGSTCISTASPGERVPFELIMEQPPTSIKQVKLQVQCVQ